MRAYDLILMVVANESGGRLVGRTLLQKKIYFLKEMMNAQIRFIPHYYGPYSRNVASSVDSLVSTGILVEKSENIPVYQTTWGDSTRYHYSINDDVDVENILKNSMGSDYDKALGALEKINTLPEADDYKALSIAAKVRQILKEKGRLKISAFPKEAESLGWNLSQYDIDQAIKILKKLKLIAIKK